ncbi:hypothetical protein, partial [Hymenobacter caeli]|uniref:hypothetical protein n=1 Tax=Hymenobacter caeli TaxID=2735894 RepID=UPI001C2CFD4F
LRRLSGVFLVFSALMTQEIYVLLLCALTRPPQEVKVVRHQAISQYLAVRPDLGAQLVQKMQVVVWRE